MLHIEELADWLAAQGVTAPIRCNVMPDEGPDEMVVLNEIAGLQTELQDALDTPVVKVRCRGATVTTARDLAHQVDRTLIDASTPFFLGNAPGTPVLARGRFGGPPWPAGVDRMERTVYECNYWLSVLR